MAKQKKAKFNLIDESSGVLLPKRATTGSAGYDFHAPDSLLVEAHGSIKFKTGVWVDIPKGQVLLLFPRSGLGMKGIRIANTVGVIDSDYKEEIVCKLINDSDEDIFIEEGNRYMQGVFVKFFTAEEDEVTEDRTGGMGSTGK